MRTGKYFKYLMAMIVALSTSVNAMAQERALKIYFNEYVSGETTPRIYVTDDHPNSEYDIPSGVTVSQNGAEWASGARWFEFFEQTVTDRVIADYSRDKNGNTDKMSSSLKLTFKNFPYEVNTIQWNTMNDLFSGSIMDFFNNISVTTKCVPVSGSGFTYTNEHWDLNLFTHNVTFGQADIPWRDGAVLNGLKSFEISEKNYFKIGIGPFTFYSQQAELKERCRTFIKAAWNGVTGTGSNILDDDDENWAFKVKFTLPDVRMRCRKIATGNVDNNIIVQEQGVHQLEGYIYAHPGAVQGKIDDPQDPDDFHFEYTVADADKNKIEVAPYTGIITKVKAAGTATVRVTLMRGDRVVSYYDQTIRISAVDPNAPEIAIAFANGKKGYDITVGDTNAQIQGIITKNGKDSNGNTITNYSSYHYEYSVDDTEIATINSSTGVITALKEGDVNVSAVLKDANGNIKSNTYTYNLHVFAKHEGLEFRRINTYHYSNSSNQYTYQSGTDWWGNPEYSTADRTTWNVGTTSSDQNYDWKSNNLLKVNTSINHTNSSVGVDDWKQIASFSTGEFSYWRAICQEIAFDVYVPKYTKSVTQYSFAGNAAIGSKKTHATGGYSNSTGDCKYGFEINYLNQKWVNGKPVNEQITLEQANTKLQNRNWNTNAAVVTETFARSGASSYTSNVGAANAIIREIDNVTSPKCNENRKLTVYFAVMAYLWNNESYPGNVSIGFKGIPEYTYYSTVTYHNNDGTGAILGSEEFNTQSKTETKVLYSNLSSTTPTRTGYTFAGWSTDPNSETATVEYTLNGNFRVYDAENGGGMGPVNLYAVWIPNSYTVELRKNATNAVAGTESVTAIYGMPLPEGEDIVAPTRVGYDFTGYYRTRAIANSELRDTTYYYDKDMKSGPVWDRTTNLYVLAKWVAHTTKITFDPQGGNNYGVSGVTATYAQAMPTMGVQAPTRDGYEFGGYFTKQNGKGTKYYNVDMTSAKNWNIDQPEYTLYAYWIPNEYMVRLDKQGGTGGSTSVIATYGEPLPSGETAPTKVGYEFRGYYSSQNDEWQEAQGNDSYNNDKQYYDKDMVGVEPWDIAAGATIYAHWAPKTYIVTLDADGGVLPNPVVDDNAGNFAITKDESNSVMTIPFVYGLEKTNEIVHSAAKKPGYEFLGWYDSKNVKVIGVEESRNCTITDNGGYWIEGGKKYNYTDNLTLKAHYRKKYTYADNIVTFGKDEKGNPERVEAEEDWLFSVVNDLVGAAKDVYDNEEGHPQTMVFDLRQSVNRWSGNNYPRLNVMQSLQKDEYKDYISPNVLVYFNDNEDKAWYVDNNVGDVSDCYNAVSLDNKCKRLVVTDRYSIKIPTAFDADKALYERNKLQIDTDDPMWVQSHESLWGTLCLPYPVKNNNTHKVLDGSGNEVVDCHVVFYELYRKSGNVMQFYKIPENAEIPANTPILYERTVGVSSAVTIEEVSGNDGKKINVPENPNFAAGTKNYSSSALSSAYDWQFIGNMQERTFYGKNHSKKFEDLLPGEEKETSDNIYYFKKDNFTRMGDKNYMILYPYRAYFREVGGADSDAKVGSYSILVVDEEGATDITNAIYGDGEGDGKIYDLNGIRVMQPVKGRLYIVNGKKKIYK